MDEEHIKLGAPQLCPVCKLMHPPVPNCKGNELPAYWRMMKEKDIRPQKDWWAPGDYTRQCKKCKNYFLGDKRAGTCAPCANGEVK
jgi:hypothetical protein